jgi:hypothetical protein
LNFKRTDKTYAREMEHFTTERPFQRETGTMRNAYPSVFVFLLLAGCQTGAEYQAKVDADRAARLQTWIGRTMADFMRDTGMTPSTTYDTSAGRVFLVDGPAVTLALAPAYGSPGVARSFACRIQLETVATGQTSGADVWRIVAVSSTGPC